MTTRDDPFRLEESRTGELFTHDAAYIGAFVRQAFSGGIPPEDLTQHQMLWYSIASTAKLYAFTSGSGPCDVDLAWAEVADLTYQYLSGLPGREHMMASWMGMKVRLINCLGDLIDVSLACPHDVFAWFDECRTLPYEEVRRLLAVRPADIDPEQSMAIGRMRECSRLIGHLRHTREFRASPDYQRWVDLFRFDSEW